MATNAPGGGGGGAAPTAETFQQTYVASTQPQVTLNATQGGMRFRDAATPLADAWSIADSTGATTYVTHSSLGTRVAAGTAADPGYAFVGDEDTGFFRAGANEIGVSVGTADIWHFDSAGNFIAQAGGTGRILSGLGAASLPTHGFAGFAGIGMFSAAGTALSFATNNAEQWRIVTGGALQAIGTLTEIRNRSGAFNDPTYTFSSDLGSGMWSPATNELGFTTAVTHQWTLNATGDWVDIVGGNLVDGVDISAHAADATIHFTVGSIDHGLLDAASRNDDDHPNNAYLLGRGSNQSYIGTTISGGTLGLTGSSHADGGYIELNDHVRFNFAFRTGAEASGFAWSWDETFTTTTAYIGGLASSTPDLTYENGVMVYSFFNEGGVYRAGVGPGFAAWTFAHVGSRITNQTIAGGNNGLNFNLVSSLSFNDAVIHERVTAGTSVVASKIGHNFQPQARTTISGGIIDITSQTFAQVLPTFSTVAGGTARLGLVRGIWFRNPTNALFQPFAGTETWTGGVAIDVDALPFGGNTTKIALRSGITAASNSYFLQNNGGAQSDFGGGFIVDTGLVQVLSDTLGISLGLAGGDVQIIWDGTNEVHNPLVGDNWNIAYATNIHTHTSSSTSEDSAVNFDYAKGAFGEGGAPGNNKWRWVTQSETITVGGDFTQFLYSQAANDTIDAALGTYAGLTFNAPTPVVGSGSVTTVTGALFGGNPTVGTNRAGVTITSNPVGGGGVNAALWVTAGRAQFDGFIDINKPVALGGGAVATLGTIGGAGPTAAAQAQWVQIEVAGVNHWIAAWV